MTGKGELAAWSQGVIAQGSQSFAAASRLLPKQVRQDTVMFYAWCRYADDVIDGQELGAPGSAQHDAGGAVLRLREQTLRALNSDMPVSAPFAALRHVARRHEFPESWPLTLLEGFAMDAAGQRPETLNDTLDYAYRVAGVVGVMMARIMGVEDEDGLDRACDLGIAMQLTNIARDPLEDIKIDRVYLPGEWVRQSGARIDGPGPSPALFAVIERLIKHAEPYYASGLAGLAYLPLREAWSIAAARRIYREIGQKILRQGPNIYASRIRTTPARKSAMIAGALTDALSTRGGLPSTPRPEGLWTRPQGDMPPMRD